MPIYTYECEKCKTIFDAFASIKKKQVGWQPACPKCGSPQTRQIFRPVMIVKNTRSSTPPGGGCCSR
jgi:putative FmdB family regulatory protein